MYINKSYTKITYCFLSIFYIFLFVKAEEEGVANTNNSSDLSQLFAKIRESNKETEKIIQKAQEIITGQKAEKEPFDTIAKKKEILEAEKRERITDSWKKRIKEDFYKNIEFILQIIQKGEKDAEELKDFEDRFDKLKSWFNEKLDKIGFFEDKNYKILVHKKVGIEKVVKAQQKAQVILLKKIEELNAQADQNIANLLILYEINAIIAKQEKEERSQDEIGIPDEQIEKIVIQAIEKSKTVKAQIDESEVILEQIKKIKEKLAHQDEMLSMLQKKIKQKVEISDKEKLELEVEFKKTKKESEEGKKRAIGLARREIIKECKTDLEQSIKSSLTAELKLEKCKEEKEEIRGLLVKTLQTAESLKEKLDQANLQIEKDKKIAKIEEELAQRKKEISTTTENEIPKMKELKKRIEKLEKVFL